MSVFQSFGPGDSNGREVDILPSCKRSIGPRFAKRVSTDSGINVTRISNRYTTYVPVTRSEALDNLLTKNIKFLANHRAGLHGFRLGLTGCDAAADQASQSRYAANARAAAEAMSCGKSKAVCNGEPNQKPLLERCRV